MAAANFRQKLYDFCNGQPAGLRGLYSLARVFFQKYFLQVSNSLCRFLQIYMTILRSAWQQNDLPLLHFSKPDCCYSIILFIRSLQCTLYNVHSSYYISMLVCTKDIVYLIQWIHLYIIHFAYLILCTYIMQ